MLEHVLVVAELPALSCVLELQGQAAFGAGTVRVEALGHCIHGRAHVAAHLPGGLAAVGD
jgi:hypothetical protein